MLKRTGFVFAAFLALANVSYAWPLGMEGYWHGVVKMNRGVFHINMTISKTPDGAFQAQYDNTDLGLYNANFKNVSIKGSDLHAEPEFGGEVNLHLDWLGQTLVGTGKTPIETYPIEMKRGKDFILPRLNIFGGIQTNYRYRVPEKTNDGLETADLRNEKGDVKLVEEGVGTILSLGLDRVHSLLVLRHGKVVLDEYFYGYQPEDKQQIYSVTKSVFATLFGMAQDQGLLNVSQKLYDLFPEYRKEKSWQKKKNKITVGMLLSMVSGFDRDDLANMAVVNPMTLTPDWVSYCLELPVVHEPGTFWAYNGTSLHPLSFLIAEKSGKSIPEFAQTYLYNPLGIYSPDWGRGPHSITRVDTFHSLSARDMAKLGQLYLNKGQWNGKQVLSAQWVEQATAFHAKTTFNFWHQAFDYGYLWYSTPVSYHGKNITAYFADGWGGQYIWYVPDLDLVTVMTAGNGDSVKEFDFFEKYIVNAF